VLTAIAALSSLLLAQAAPPAPGSLPILEDWLAVGPLDAGENPRPKGILAPRAAAALVAALDASPAGAHRMPTRAKRDAVVENLRRLFRPTGDPSGPSGLAPPEVLAAQAESIRRMTVLGLQPLASHRLLVVEANAVFSEPGGGFVPARLAFLVDGAGKVQDAATLSWSDGDACFSQGRSYRMKPGGIELTDATVNEGELCAPEDPARSDCCFYVEGERFDLFPGAGGLLRESERRRLNLSGQFLDAATGEQLRIEDYEDRAPRVGYRAKAGTEWKRLALVTFDRERRVLVAKFPSGPTTYTLTLDGRPAPATALVSQGSDGTKAQTFRLMPWADR
jgi:hypothetical protein